MLKRSLVVGFTVVLFAALAAAVAQAALGKPVHRRTAITAAAVPGESRTAASPHKSTAAAVEVGDTGAGAVLTNSSGHVLFIFAKDKRSKDSCKAIKNCETDWPPLTTTGKPVAGAGVKASLLKTIPYKGKLREVTYGGHVLHTYKFDDGAATSFMFIGIKQFGAAWYGLTAADTVVKTPSG